MCRGVGGRGRVPLLSQGVRCHGSGLMALLSECKEVRNEEGASSTFHLGLGTPNQDKQPKPNKLVSGAGREVGCAEGAGSEAQKGSETEQHRASGHGKCW